MWRCHNNPCVKEDRFEALILLGCLEPVKKTWCAGNIVWLKVLLTWYWLYKLSASLMLIFRCFFYMFHTLSHILNSVTHKTQETPFAYRLQKKYSLQIMFFSTSFKHPRSYFWFKSEKSGWFNSHDWWHEGCDIFVCLFGAWTNCLEMCAAVLSADVTWSIAFFFCYDCCDGFLTNGIFKGSTQLSLLWDICMPTSLKLLGFAFLSGLASPKGAQTP